jgi:hypothetical protein
MSVTLSAALGGNEEAIASFERLGLSVADLQKMSPDARFRAVAEAIAKIPDPADRAAASMRMFGVDLTPVIDALLKLKDVKIPKLSEEELKKLAEAKEAMDKLDYAWTIFMGTLAATAWPDVQAFIDKLRELMTFLINAKHWMDNWQRNVSGGPGQLPPWLTGRIPATASGGIVTSPQVRLVGEAGPEAIIPLTKLGGASTSLTLNIGSYYGDEMSKRALVRDIQRILNEETRRSFTPATRTEYYSVGGHL